MLEKPGDDPLVRNLKSIALKGGDRGKFYDNGVLAVVEQIERQGHFEHNRIIGKMGLYKVQQDIAQRMLTDEEVADVTQFVSQYGTFDEAYQYVDGLDFAERTLFPYKMRDAERSGA